MSFPTSAGNTRSGLEVAMIIGMPNSYMHAVQHEYDCPVGRLSLMLFRLNQEQSLWEFELKNQEDSTRTLLLYGTFVTHFEIKRAI